MSCQIPIFRNFKKTPENVIGWVTPVNGNLRVKLKKPICSDHIKEIFGPVTIAINGPLIKGNGLTECDILDVNLVEGYRD